MSWLTIDMTGQQHQSVGCAAGENDEAICP